MMSYFVLYIVQVSNYTLPDDVAEVTYDVILYVTFDHVMCYCEQGPVIDVGQDYSKDRINDYTVERDDCQLYCWMHDGFRAVFISKLLGVKFPFSKFANSPLNVEICNKLYLTCKYFNL